ncbi:MAG: hypothetical protein GC192_17635 [Bacteroidetes bacterium]|nr:hypothetical protein [Bacteroidota bacterium]
MGNSYQDFHQKPQKQPKPFFNWKSGLGLGVVLLFLIWNRSGKITLPGVEVQLDQKVESMRNDEAALKKLLDESNNLNRKLKDSIATMLYQRRLDISEGEELSAKFKQFKDLPAADKEALLNKVNHFLSPDTNPDVNIDYGLLAAERLRQLQNNEIETLRKRPVSNPATEDALRSEVEKLSSKIRQLENDKKATLARYEQLKSDYEGLKRKLAEYGEGNTADSIAIVAVLDNMKNKLDSLANANVALADAIDNTISLSIIGGVLEPEGSKRSKQKVFTKDFKAFTFTFLPKSTNTRYKGAGHVRLRLIFSIPKPPGERYDIERIIDVNLDQKELVKIEYGSDHDANGKAIEFADGTYAVQVFLFEDEVIKEPISWHRFEFKKKRL